MRFAGELVPLAGLLELNQIKPLGCQTGAQSNFDPPKAFWRSVKPEKRRDPAALNTPEAHRGHTGRGLAQSESDIRPYLRTRRH
jgi:hypothetical protein